MDSKNVYQCDLCGKTFVHKSLLKRHSIVHKKYTCKTCGHLAKDMAEFKLHMQSHEESSIQSHSFCNENHEKAVSVPTHWKRIQTLDGKDPARISNARTVCSANSSAEHVVSKEISTAEELGSALTAETVGLVEVKHKIEAAVSSQLESSEECEFSLVTPDVFVSTEYESLRHRINSDDIGRGQVVAYGASAGEAFVVHKVAQDFKSEEQTNGEDVSWSDDICALRAEYHDITGNQFKQNALSHCFNFSVGKRDFLETDQSKGEDCLTNITLKRKFSPWLSTGDLMGLDLSSRNCLTGLNYSLRMTKHLKIPKRKRKNYPCSKCSKIFSCEYLLKRHSVTHKSYTCGICGHLSKNLVTFTSHKKTHEVRGMFSCHLCKENCNESAILAIHMKHKHDIDRSDQAIFNTVQTVIYRCDRCSDVFPDGPDATHHILQCPKQDHFGALEQADTSEAESSRDEAVSCFTNIQKSRQGNGSTKSDSGKEVSMVDGTSAVSTFQVPGKLAKVAGEIEGIESSQEMQVNVLLNSENISSSQGTISDDNFAANEQVKGFRSSSKQGLVVPNKSNNYVSKTEHGKTKEICSVPDEVGMSDDAENICELGNVTDLSLGGCDQVSIQYGHSNCNQVIVNDIGGTSVRQKACANPVMLREDQIISNLLSNKSSEMFRQSVSQAKDLKAQKRKKKTYQCGQCDKIFYQENLLRRHSVTHMNYTCGICGQMSQDLASFSSHKQTHEVKGMYSCYLCDEKYRKSVFLAKHMKQVHNIDQRDQARNVNERTILYRCSDCDVVFADGPEVMEHVDKCPKRKRYVTDMALAERIFDQQVRRMNILDVSLSKSKECHTRSVNNLEERDMGIKLQIEQDEKRGQWASDKVASFKNEMASSRNDLSNVPVCIKQELQDDHFTVVERNEESIAMTPSDISQAKKDNITT